MKTKPTLTPRQVAMEIDRPEGVRFCTNGRKAGESSLLIRNILVPIDFSECSRKALHYAGAFARLFNARITLLHVFRPLQGGGGEMGAIDYLALENESRACCERQLEELAREELGKGITFEVEVRNGHTVSEITRAAKECEADVLVVSTHGRTGIRHALLGSIAESVVQHASCPVLVVREHEHEFVQSLTSTDFIL